ncbi:hypothetical protein OKA05_21495 [Luteolibacter arcticus]|uniref:DUF4398 domain-containing protein n=1 Tax=Luteolibacter arcticus TaxID=1581411 RepID=A0ABT3GNT4_9BACT|nr:hypothetical protein [Luteolibacter arcticus]MCW1925149.1 hypothetical protein [Luteolibacter arcticus]
MRFLVFLVSFVVIGACKRPQPPPSASEITAADREIRDAAYEYAQAEIALGEATAAGEVAVRTETLREQKDKLEKVKARHAAIFPAAAADALAEESIEMMRGTMKEEERRANEFLRSLEKR